MLNPVVIIFEQLPPHFQDACEYLTRRGFQVYALDHPNEVETLTQTPDVIFLHKAKARIDEFKKIKYSTVLSLDHETDSPFDWEPVYRFITNHLSN